MISNRYRPPFTQNWKGRSDPTPQSLRYHEKFLCLDMREKQQLKNPAFGLIGFACDEGVERNQGQIGAAAGPEAFRKALSPLALHAQTNIAHYDLGDVTCTDKNLEEAQLAFAELFYTACQSGITPFAIGGGHEIAFAHYLGFEKLKPLKTCGIISFDAHFDLRPPSDSGRGSSGTSFYQIAKRREEQGLAMDYTCIGIQALGNTPYLYETAHAMNTRIVEASSMLEEGIDSAKAAIDEALAKNEHVLVSICLDVFAQAIAPAVSAPQALGLYPWHILPLLRHIAASGKMHSFHIAELAPNLDKEMMTARLAASLAANLLESFR
jgi:formiminoglutamase